MDPFFSNFSTAPGGSGVSAFFDHFSFRLHLVAPKGVDQLRFQFKASWLLTHNLMTIREEERVIV